MLAKKIKIEMRKLSYRIFHKENNNQKSKEQSVYTKDVFAANSRNIIGQYTYGRPTVLEYGNDGNLIIGKFCSIAQDVTIFLGGNHNVNWISTYPFNVLNEDFPNAIGIEGHPTTKGDVIIGNDVWIGRGATILSGVTIGNGAVIGSNAVVTKNVGPYEIAVGNPAKCVRKRFEEEDIKKLLDIAWWNWTIEKINDNVKQLCDSNIKRFIETNYSK